MRVNSRQKKRWWLTEYRRREGIVRYCFEKKIMMMLKGKICGDIVNFLPTLCHGVIKWLEEYVLNLHGVLSRRVYLIHILSVYPIVNEESTNKRLHKRSNEIWKVGLLLQALRPFKTIVSHKTFECITSKPGLWTQYSGNHRKNARLSFITARQVVWNCNYVQGGNIRYHDILKNLLHTHTLPGMCKHWRRKLKINWLQIFLFFCTGQKCA